MKICIPSKEENKGSLLDSHFGRCQFFAIVDINNDNIDFIKNSGIQANRGAGITAAQVVASKNIDVVLAYNLGPKAYNALKQAGIKCYRTTEETIKDAITALKKGNVEKMNSSVPGGFGMGRQRGFDHGHGLGPRSQGRGD